MPATDRAAALQDALAPVVAGAGLVLEQVAVTPAGRRSVVRVVVDLPDGPGSLDLDEVSACSRAVSQALDGPAGDALGAAAYVLEVTSPGVDRPLTQRRHWSRAHGRLVDVVLPAGALAGRVGAVDDDGVVLDGEHVPWGRLESAVGRVRVEFSRPGADGAGDDGPAGDEDPADDEDPSRDGDDGGGQDAAGAGAEHDGDAAGDGTGAVGAGHERHERHEEEAP